ncbi:MAG: hypothetical protein KAG26_06855 [Methylococcales bacterium]|nr:hypothetical protein [Methylococcales bacterium]
MSKRKKPLKAVLHGMDERLQRNMLLYFQNVCEDALVVVSDAEAEIDMIDIDSAEGQKVLAQLQREDSNRPIVVLSRSDVDLDNISFILKPISLKKVLATFDRLRFLVDRRNSQKKPTGASVEKKSTNNSILLNLKDKVAESKPVLEVRRDVVVKKDVSEDKVVSIDTDEIKKVSKHKTAQQLNENRFASFIGMMMDIDFNNAAQLAESSYSPKDYYQGYVAATFKVAKAKGRTLQLNSSWKPLLIFPHSNEVWLDADDQQLRAFSSVELNKATGVKLSVSAASSELTNIKQKLERFYDMDAFIWKLAIWTSRGRYPEIINVKRAVFLLRWPNFTRSIITPHALRMTALLVHEPKTMLSIAEGLQIKPQYVFAFISGAYALGLVRQPMKTAEEEDEGVVVRPVVISPKKKGLLSRILSRLRS